METIHRKKGDKKAWICCEGRECLSEERLLVLCFNKLWLQLPLQNNRVRKREHRKWVLINRDKGKVLLKLNKTNQLSKVMMQTTLYLCPVNLESVGGSSTCGAEMSDHGLIILL